MFIILILFSVIIKNCSAMQKNDKEWISVTHSNHLSDTPITNKIRSMSEGGVNPPIQSIQQQRQRVNSMPQGHQQEQFRKLGYPPPPIEMQQQKLTRSAPIQDQTQEIEEQAYQANIKQEKTLSEQLKKEIIIENVIIIRKEIIRLKSEINRYEIKKNEDSLNTKEINQNSRNHLIAANNMLHAQKDKLAIEWSLITEQFDAETSELLRIQYARKAAEIKDLEALSHEIQIIEIDEILEKKGLSSTERNTLEVKSLTLKWHVKKYELSKIESSMESTSLSESDINCLPFEADIVRKEIRIIEINGHFKAQNVPLGKEESWKLELGQLNKEVEVLEKRKQYIQIKYQIKSPELKKSEQIKLETAFAFLHVEILISQKIGEEYTEQHDILKYHKRTYERMTTIEGHFREDQNRRISPASLINGSRVQLRIDPLANYAKHALSVEYSSLYNQVRLYTIETLWKNEHTKEDSRRSMGKEYHGASPRYPFIKNESTGRYEFIEDTERSIHDYGLTEAYLLNDDQRCLLGIKYLELTDLEPIEIEFLAQGGPV